MSIQVHKEAPNMTILELTFATNQLTTTFFNHKLEPLHQKTFPFEALTIEETVPELCQLIVAEAAPILGGIVADFPEDFFSPEETLALVPQAVIQAFAEQLNTPLLTAAEQAAAPNLLAAFEEKRQYLAWHLDYYGYVPGKNEYAVESLLTVGNGFLGLRGTTPEMTISDDHYPATYIAGLYNTAASEVAGQVVENEDFVNAPDNQHIALKIGDATDWLTISPDTLQQLHRQLNLKTGLFVAEMILKDADNQQIKLTTKKIANMAQPNDYHLQYTFEPLNFSAPITLKTVTDGSVYKYNVARYRNLTAKHFQVTALSAQENKTVIEVCTNQSNLSVRETALITGDFFEKEAIMIQEEAEKIAQVVTVMAHQGTRYTLEKQVFVQASHAEQSWQVPFTPKDSFAAAAQESARAWQTLWQQANITVTGDLMSQKLLRIHSYHLLASASPFSNQAQALDVSITARGLHGEAYRGHIFWDEIFILPFYIQHYPDTAKQLLLYRYHRLEKAKENAAASQYRGAMYPWQSGRDGRETTQKLHLNPLNGHWGEDHSILQRHVSLAIAYNAWLYWHSTQDHEFMKQYGGEMLLEIAQFWNSAATLDDATGRFFIDKVMGPDEFHEGYPDQAESGLKNNAYTNLMVVWLFEELTNILALFSEEEQAQLFAKTQTSSADLARMQQIQNSLEIEVNSDGIIAQYEGYFGLKEIDWAAMKEKYGNIYRMDRILKAEGESPDDYKVAKQADTLMLFYNLDKTRVDQILEDLGYQLPADYLEKNLLYYLKRTSHGSTLSRIVHAQLAEMAQFHELSWQLYQEALYSDYRDIQGGTTAEGIHTGVMAATIHVTLATYAGVDTRQNELSICPNLPEHWQALAFQFIHQGVTYQFSLTQTSVTITADKDTQLLVQGALIPLTAERPKEVHYQ
ncbi:glycoside hydrolase family 65 protein [Enterococcus faecalis]|uniref:glycoside hydrolase family 65 protein n=1 Tax=Enterococcus faecalis TaxID=1351 RepID=UPI003CFE8386